MAVGRHAEVIGWNFCHDTQITVLSDGSHNIAICLKLLLCSHSCRRIALTAIEASKPCGLHHSLTVQAYQCASLVNLLRLGTLIVVLRSAA
jgi:hypothetical protein